MNFWAYHSCGDADVHDQTASEDIETVTRGEQTEIWNLGGVVAVSWVGKSVKDIGEIRQVWNKVCHMNKKLSRETAAHDRSGADVENTTFLPDFCKLSVFLPPLESLSD